jgi:aquaporin Z
MEDSHKEQHSNAHGDAGGASDNARAARDARTTGARSHPFIEARRLLAELLGTFALTFTAAGGPVIVAASGVSVGLPALVVAPALLVMAMIYSVGNLSGAHFNPAVTLAFTLRKDFPWRRVPGYWLAQVVGAVAAALLLRALFGPVGHLGATLPHHGEVASLVMEIVLTFFLLTVILATATNHKIVGHNAALAVAGTIALDGLFAAPISGASMNPARSFGPALVGGEMSTYWIYLVGPVAGALIAVGMAWLLRGGTSAYAMEAAQGD